MRPISASSFPVADAPQIQFQKIPHQGFHDLSGQPLDLIHLALEAFQVLARVE
jgi:hypothetical protein